MAPNYTKKQISEALKEIENGKSTREISKKYGIPRTTLQDKKKGRHKKNIGAPTVLSLVEEKLLVQWVLELVDNGFLVTKSQIVYSVSSLVEERQRKHNFKGGFPGSVWYKGFLRRNPEISTRVSLNVTSERTKVTEDAIKNWFSRIASYCTDHPQMKEVLLQPQRVFHCDEFVFFLCPGETKVLVKIESSHAYSQVASAENECISVLIGSSANGVFMPAFSSLPYKRIPPDTPQSWVIGKTDSGWMTCDLFYEYIANCFYPYLEHNGIPLPIVLFLDGHSTHISLHLSNFCSEKGIILIAPLPNAPHLLQPMDLVLFQPVTQVWNEKVKMLPNNRQQLKQKDFSELVDTCLKEAVKPETIKNGFRKCGFYPFSADAVDYTEILTTNVTKSTQNQTELNMEHPIESTGSDLNDNYKIFLTILEEEIGDEKLKTFKRHIGRQWTGCEKDENLFNLWASAVEKIRWA